MLLLAQIISATMTRASLPTLLLAALPFLSWFVVPSSTTPPNSLQLKFSLAVEDYKTNILQSSDGTFSCGFYSVYNNAFTFSIWYSNVTDKAIVWSANRGRPVRSRNSAVTLRKDGKMVLTDYDGTIVWQTDGNFPNVQHAQLLDTGNLILKNSSGHTVWQSFDSPTDTILPTQRISATTKLVSTTQLNVPGHYTCRFSDQSLLSLIYDDTDVFDIYWPDPDYKYYENSRNLYNSSRLGHLDDLGRFFSSDFANHQALNASDEGSGIKRKLTLDPDGNLRLYSLNNLNRKWSVSWIAVSQPCKIHGLCGPNGICHYSPTPTCSCPPGYKMKNPGNWTQGCRAIVDITCHVAQPVQFQELRNTDFWGSDQQRLEKVSLQSCQEICTKDCTCKGFQYQEGNGTCYPKSLLFNGRTYPTPVVRTMYIKLPASVIVSNNHIPQSNMLDSTPHYLDCDLGSMRNGQKFPDKHNTGGDESKWFYLYGFVVVLFVIEVLFFALAWCFVLRREWRSSQLWPVQEGYKVMSSHFRRYSYGELVKATAKFRVEIGRGDSGIVYKGLIKDDDRTVAVKKLINVRKGEEEFHAELSIIRRIYHMNLVRIWGFCSEGSHRLLVSEFFENGSLANILFNKKNCILLEWKQRFNIALGVAKGLAYLHHECLEWVIHCDVKPDNILLDKKFEPKITDFGLVKLLNRGRSNRNIPHVRGTLGYIAPEWVSGLPITAKVDVYSYGVVILELLSGNRVSELPAGSDEEVYTVLRKLVKMLADKLQGEEQSWIAEFVECKLSDQISYMQARILMKLAISCLEGDRSKRPTMESIVQTLLSVDEAGTALK